MQPTGETPLLRQWTSERTEPLLNEPPPENTGQIQVNGGVEAVGGPWRSGAPLLWGYA
jgi:hypothetical protein